MKNTIEELLTRLDDACISLTNISTTDLFLLLKDCRQYIISKHEDDKKINERLDRLELHVLESVD